MPECHKCPLNQTGDPRCLSCAGPRDDKHRGQSFIPLQNIPESQLPAMPPTADDHPMSEFMRVWLRIRPQTRDIIAYWIANPAAKQTALARKFRISPQTLHARMIRVCRNCPPLRVFISARCKPVRRLFFGQ